MFDFSHLTAVLAVFFILALASKQFGDFFSRARLPLITGFLFAGMVVGPNVLELIDAESVERLRFVDQVSLAVIAFAAGAELHMKELRGRLTSIGWITVAQLVFTFGLGVTAILLLADYIPFLCDSPTSFRVGLSLLGGAILVARSPSSAIAIITEMRAKGPFTQTALGVTVVTDVAVIVVFAISMSVADSLIMSVRIDLAFAAELLGELAVSVGLGFMLGKFLGGVLAAKLYRFAKVGIILLSGYGIFFFTDHLREYSIHHMPFEVYLEPLLMCMVAGFVVTNYTRQRRSFAKTLTEVTPAVFVAFFTLVGASLSLGVLRTTWLVTLVLVGVRASGIFLGCLAGGVVAKDPPQHYWRSWMAYITQAGVGLGLAKEVADMSPGWGDQFATTIIAVIIFNQIAGPPFFKWVLQMVGEAHNKPKFEAEPYDGVRDAVIFGLGNNAYQLAVQLSSHGWQVKIASRQLDYIKMFPDPNGFIHHVPDFGLESLLSLEAQRAEAMVSMITSDEDALELCDLVRDNFEVEHLIVRLNDIAYAERFRQFDAVIVEPTYAIINLLDHLVRAPLATSLIMGMDSDHDIVGLEVRDPVLEGMYIHELRLPFDVIILSITRKGNMVMPDANTEILLGDLVTLAGPQKSLETAALLFDVNFPVGRPVTSFTPPPVVDMTPTRRTRRTDSESFELVDYLDADLMAARIVVADKKELFVRIAELIARLHDVAPDKIEAALWERESQKNSIIVDGLAIPHAMVEQLDRTYLGVMTLAEPVDYLEEKDADIIVFMLGPLDDRHNYLKLLASMASMCTAANLLDRLREATSPEQIEQTILDCNLTARSADNRRD